MKSTRGRGKRLVWLGMAALAVAALAPVARADDPDPGQPAAQQQQASVARLSYVDGKVQISQGNQVLADQAPLNAPLLAGATLTTEQDGQAEVEFADGSIARISPNSSLTLSSLPGTGGQGVLALNSGLGYFELQSGSLSVRFADAAASVAGATIFRVDMDNPPGNLAVFSGNVHLVRGDALALDLHGGESVALNAGDASQYDLSESIESDSWDQWNSDRDQALSSEGADQTGATAANPEGDTPAWNDLAANGNWYNVPGEGQIWSPYEAASADWDPYGCGNWVWTPGYGYTWASCETWGFLPYQCGAWNFYDGFGWGWSPGWMRGCGVGAGFWFRTFPGVHVIHGPVGYPPVVRPGPRFAGGPAHALIAVNRHFTLASGALPSRDRNNPVQIAGATVMPMRAQVYRQAYSNGASSSTRPVYGTQGRTAFAPAGGSSRSGYAPPSSSYRSAPNSGAPTRSAPAPSPYRGTYTPPSRPAPPPPPSRPATGGSRSAPRR